MCAQQMIDVSEWQGDINWDKVKSAGYHAILRMGWYGKTGAIDKKFTRNINACISRGIPFGIYIYNYATSTANATAMADWVNGMLGSAKPAYGIFLDLEEKGTEAAALNVHNAFYQKMKALGWPIVGLYTNLNWWNNHGMKNAKFDKLWLAQWGSSHSINCDIWQYSSKGSVPGISGNVDMNVCYYNPYQNTQQNAQPAQSSKLVVDGIWGKQTTLALQKYLGTPQDGIISGQWVGYRTLNPGLSSQSWEWVNSTKSAGSQCIKALQKLLGVKADGLFGKITCTALQKRLGTVQDGTISKPSQCVKALQTALNNGKL